MKITIVYDNESTRSDLQADWGFACVIEKENVSRILFDTGADGDILISNMQKLNIDPQSIDMVFISHPHFDHIGGLAEFIRENRAVTLVAPQSFRGVKRVRKVIEINTSSREIAPGVFTTGEIQGMEQALCIKTSQGIVTIAGCSHPGITAILQAARALGTLRALIGGFHGFKAFKDLSLLPLICPAHCTQYKDDILAMYPETARSGGVGKVFELE